MTPPRTLSLPWALVVAASGGVLTTLAFPTVGVWPLAPLGVGALSWAVDGQRARRGALLGFVYGATFLLPLLKWTGVYVGPAPWIILALAEAAFFAGLGAILPSLQRLPVAPLWVGAGWVLQESLRDRGPFGGFPWGRLAFSQSASPLRWFAPLGGAPLVTFVVAVCGGALALAVRAVVTEAPRRSRTMAATVALLAAVAVPLAGGLLSWPLGPPPDDHGSTATVALIQGSVPDRGLGLEDRARQVLDNHVQQTLNLAAEINAGTAPRPSIVFWPENASDVDPYQDPTAAAEIERAVKAVGVPILVGAILNRPDPTHRENAGILWTPTGGPVATYLKRHPVPFGEYIPLRGLAKLVSSDVNLVTQDMVAGHGNGLMRGGPFLFGDVICFEVAYDSLVQSSVAAGARLLVVQTNNATFGHTAETYQQLAMSRLRAVETGRTVLQVATTGMSAIIGPDGGVRAHSGALFTPAILDLTVPLRSADTLAVRLGTIPEYALGAIAMAGLFWARRRARPAWPPHWPRPLRRW